jgi:hypothetical protein
MTGGNQGNMAVVQNVSGIIATEVGRRLGLAMQNAAKLGPPHAGGTIGSEDAKPYTQDQVATLLGFHGAMNVKYLIKMWRLFKTVKMPNYDHLRRAIKGEMIRWANKQQSWIEEGVYFDNKSLDEWIAHKFNPGDSTALYSSADKGISILKCRTPTTAHLQVLRQKEEIWDANKGNATYVEVVKQAKSKDVSPPVHNFGELWSNIATFCALLFTLFGEGCDLYRSMLQILQILSHPLCMQNKQAYTPEVCRRITWAIIVDTQSFFDDIKLAEISSSMGTTCNSRHLHWKVTSCQSSMASKFKDTTSHLSGVRRNLSTAPQSPTTQARAAEGATNPYYHQ